MTDQLPADIAEAIEAFEACLEGTARGYAAGDHATVRAALDAVILKHLGSEWRPISECPPKANKIIGWCVFGKRDVHGGAYGEARGCGRYIDHEGHAHPWMAHGCAQTVTHFKPWPTDDPPTTDLGRSALAEEGGGGEDTLRHLQSASRRD